MSIGEISRRAASSAELAREARISAEEADSTISALALSTEHIGQIVELIHSIAQRTNLLALNASIEAARSAEAGRGFAVVAAEVKDLAEQTSRATDDVAAQIQAIQRSSRASVAGLKKIHEQIRQVEGNASAIAQSVDEQSVASSDLARNLDLAAGGAERIRASAGQVREMSLSTGSAASQVLGAASGLQEQAAALRVQVEDFLGYIRTA